MAKNKKKIKKTKKIRKAEKKDVTPARLLVVLPSWIGDVVMATPALRALRELYRESKITYMVKSYVRPVIDGVPWYDHVIELRGKGARRKQRSRKIISRGRDGGVPWPLAVRLRRRRFDMAILMSNSFRAAMLVRMANISRRVGYDRDGQGVLLTDLLLPMREGSKLVPRSKLEYYLGMARYLGAHRPRVEMELFTRDEDDVKAEAMLRGGGVDVSEGLLAVMSPGVGYGKARMWGAKGFAEVADYLVKERGAKVLLNGAEGERGVLDAVHGYAESELVDLPRLGCDLTLLKSVVKRSGLVVGNDGGVRQMGAAFGVPVVTVFGPSDPRWSETGFEGERRVMADVFCRPCQRKECPLDHRCMTEVSADMMIEGIEGLLGG